MSPTYGSAGMYRPYVSGLGLSVHMRIRETWAGVGTPRISCALDGDRPRPIMKLCRPTDHYSSPPRAVYYIWSVLGSKALYQGRIQDLWKGGGGAQRRSRLKTLFGISKGGGGRTGRAPSLALLEDPLWNFKGGGGRAPCAPPLNPLVFTVPYSACKTVAYPIPETYPDAFLIEGFPESVVQLCKRIAVIFCLFAPWAAMVSFAQAGNVSKWKYFRPHVLIVSVSTMMDNMFITIPAFAWNKYHRQRHDSQKMQPTLD